jgi:hypothetical protein
MAMYEVFNIVKNEEGKGFWTRVGVAFENKDGSLNVKLNCLPLNGTLHIREKEKKE